MIKIRIAKAIVLMFILLSIYASVLTGNLPASVLSIVLFLVVTILWIIVEDEKVTSNKYKREIIMMNWLRNVRIISLVRVILILLFLVNLTGFILSVTGGTFVGMVINGTTMGICLYMLLDLRFLIHSILDPILLKDD